MLLSGLFYKICIPIWVFVVLLILLLITITIYILKKQIYNFLVKLGNFLIFLIKLVKKNYRFLTSFIIFIWLVSVSEIYLESSLIYLPKTIFPFLSGNNAIKATFVLVILLLVFLLPNIFNNYRKILKIQKINKQHSWIIYFHFSFFLSPIISLIIFHFKIFPDFFHGNFLVFFLFEGTSLISIIIRLVWLIFGTIWFLKIKPLSLDDQIKNWRFAPFSVNTKMDRFNWKDSANRKAKQILDIDKFVSVVVIDGKQGNGKSSYARMIIDSLINIHSSKIIYTYISLTETNQEKDFTKMFLERCFESIGERYPKINFSNILPVVREGLRDNGYGILSAVIDFLSRFNVGIYRTKAVVHDPSCPAGDYVQKNVAEKFGYIEEVNEKVWIIHIDEIDRAPANEIYRVIETIERYKYDGRTGLPVKIVFVLCVDRLKLFKNMELSND